MAVLAPADIVALERATGLSPLLEGVTAELHGHTVHAEVCREVLAQQRSGFAPNSDATPPHPELNINNPDCGTALHWAIAQDMHEAALALVQCPQFLLINARLPCSSTALHLAAAHGMPGVMEALLQRQDFAAVTAQDNDGFTALHGAAYCGHTRCVEILLDQPMFGVVSAVAGAFDYPRRPGHWARQAAEDYDMSTALHMAAAKNHAEICTMILTKASSTVKATLIETSNRIGANALHIAARSRSADALAALLKHPATTEKAVNAHDARGFTMLHWAAQEARGVLCDLVLKRQDFTALEKKDLRRRTALDMAKELRHFEVERLILARMGPEHYNAMIHEAMDTC
eukprot:TRINITY_DN40895_c0_g1_i1.p1 TRINITY_DN40895_c0_g1~~TRINITY_DN40895_c0_g1_i1.p1  ORF type:complete len:345 (+),score=73.08 TRINITY_DN40895_c0_g1_i1:90-1124(+)